MSPTETFDILMYYIMHYINSMHTKSSYCRPDYRHNEADAVG